VTLAVKGNSSSGSAVRCRRMPVFYRHRLPLTRSRKDTRWLSGRVKTPTFCVFPLLSVAVVEECCDSCGDGDYYLRSGCSASKDVSALEALVAVDRKSIQHAMF
jgi:hypothetical protein